MVATSIGAGDPGSALASYGVPGDDTAPRRAKSEDAQRQRDLSIGLLGSRPCLPSSPRRVEEAPPRREPKRPTPGWSRCCASPGEHGGWTRQRVKVTALGSLRPAGAPHHLVLGPPTTTARIRRVPSQFETALEDASARADLDQGTLYNAAARRAGECGGEDEVAKTGGQSDRLAGEDLRLRRELLARLGKEIEGSPASDRMTSLKKQREAQIAQLEHARTRTPTCLAGGTRSSRRFSGEEVVGA